jgi:hypothetical protein
LFLNPLTGRQEATYVIQAEFEHGGPKARGLIVSTKVTILLYPDLPAFVV